MTSDTRSLVERVWRESSGAPTSPFWATVLPIMAQAIRQGPVMSFELPPRTKVAPPISYAAFTPFPLKDQAPI